MKDAKNAKAKKTPKAADSLLAKLRALTPPVPDISDDALEKLRKVFPKSSQSNLAWLYHDLSRLARRLAYCIRDNLYDEQVRQLTHECVESLACGIEDELLTEPWTTGWQLKPDDFAPPEM